MTAAPLQTVIDYYTAKVLAHGAAPAGVDWNGAAGQARRFDVLLDLLPATAAEPITLDDYGCGYGALLTHLREQGRTHVDYLGLDIAPAMIDAARAAFPADAARFHLGAASPRRADYAVASGIFNVRLDTSVAAWEAMIEATLDQMATATTRGFAFNCLTIYSDPPRRHARLHYADPLHYFDLCKRRYARNVALRHDYDLFEFTILVRHDPRP